MKKMKLMFCVAVFLLGLVASTFFGLVELSSSSEAAACRPRECNNCRPDSIYDANTGNCRPTKR